MGRERERGREGGIEGGRQGDGDRQLGIQLRYGDRETS